MLVSISSGFALPLKEEHKDFLIKALIPLHKAGGHGPQESSICHRLICTSRTMRVEICFYVCAYIYIYIFMYMYMCQLYGQCPDCGVGIPDLRSLCSRFMFGRLPCEPCVVEIMNLLKFGPLLKTIWPWLNRDFHQGDEIEAFSIVVEPLAWSM